MRRIVNLHSVEAISDPIPKALVINIDDATENNKEYRKTIWLGEFMKVNTMSIPQGREIGGEIHSEQDQFIKIESGRALVTFGKSEEEITLERAIDDDYAIIVPAGTWHNIKNIGNSDLKLISIYAPANEIYN